LRVPRQQMIELLTGVPGHSNNGYTR